MIRELEIITVMLPQKTYAGHFCQAHLINDFQDQQDKY